MQAKDVGRALEPTAGEEIGDSLLAEPLDVQRAAADEVAQAFGALRRADEPAGAADIDLALRGDRYKFIYYPGVWDTQELYDLQTDPKERHNLIDVPEHQERVRTMRGRLWDLLEAADAMSTPLRRGTGQQNQRKGGG